MPVATKYDINKNNSDTANANDRNSKSILSHDQFILGVRYIKGQDCQKNEHEALRLLKLAAAQNNAHALKSIGDMYQLGGAAVAKNHNEAYRHYQLASAVDPDNACAIYALGFCFVNSIGVEVDLEEGLKKYR